MRVVPYVLAAVLLGPSTGFASPLTFRVSDGGELAVSFGLVPFEMSASFVSEDGFIVDGLISLVSGPLLEQEFTEIGGEHFTTYRYGAGLLTMDAVGEELNGTPRAGTFTATTLPFSITVREDAEDIFEGAPAFDFDILLGDGLFDSDLAALFNVQQMTSGFDIGFGLEDIDGDPDDPVRRGFDHRGMAFLRIDAVARAVPEPSLLALTLCAAAWVVRRKARSIR